MQKLIRTGLGCVVVAALLGACGGDDAPKALTKAEYVQQANALCEQSNKDTEALLEDLPKNSTAKQFAELLVDRGEPVMRQLIDDIAALEPPEEDRELIDGMLFDLRAEHAALFGKLANDPVAGVEMLRKGQAYKKSNADARAYGLDVCGEE